MTASIVAVKRLSSRPIVSGKEWSSPKREHRMIANAGASGAAYTVTNGATELAARKLAAQHDNTGGAG